MRKILFSLSLAAGLVGTALARPYTSPDGLFQVDFPGPVKVTPENAYPKGTNYEYQPSSREQYLVGVFTTNKPMTRYQAYDKFLRPLTRSTHLTIKERVCQGHPALEVTGMDSSGTPLTALVIPLNNLLIVAASANLDLPSTRRFVDSFRLLK